MSLYLAELRASDTALRIALADESWADSDVRAPSLLPNWSRAHVLAHLARNADALAGTVAGALRGERVPRYPDGPTGRNADIEAGAGRSLAELSSDLQETTARLDARFAAVADVDGWTLECDDRTTGDYVLTRWREVEIHRVDLGGAYTADQWPPGFVDYLLPLLAGELSQRTSTTLRLEVSSQDSVSGLAGASWASGDGPDRAEVIGPDWALLAWVLGRPAAARGALNQTPALSPWT